jgi:hypothetical protein
MTGNEKYASGIKWCMTMPISTFMTLLMVNGMGIYTVMEALRKLPRVICLKAFSFTSPRMVLL